MASKNLDATRTPRSLETVLGLRAGGVYFLQNVDPTATLFLRQAAVAPAASARAHQIFAAEDITFEIDTAVRLWAWTDDPNGCACIITEAPR